MSSIFSYVNKENKNKPSVSVEDSSNTSIFKKARELAEINKEETLDESNQESYFDKGLRNTARTGMDILDTVAGVPGEALWLLSKAANPIAKLITGKEQPDYEDTALGKILPTSSSLKEKRSDYLKPKSSSEDIWSNFVEDVTSLSIPIPGKTAGKTAVKSLDFLKRLGKRIGQSSAVASIGEGSKKIAESLGVDEETAQKIKMALVFTGGLGIESGSKGGAEGYKRSLYEKMRSSRPDSATVNGKNLERSATALKNSLESGGGSPSATKALSKVNEMLESIKKNGGKIAIQELEDFGVKINELKSSLYEDFQIDKVGRKSAKRNLDAVTGLVERSLDEYSHSNKKYGQIRTEAKQAHSAIESGKAASKFITKNVSKLGQHGATAAIVGAITNPSAILPTSLALGATLSGLKGAELVTRIVKSPELRDFYLNVLDGALRKDAAFMNHNLQRLSKKIQDEPEILLED